MAEIALSYGHGENTWEDKHSKGVVVNGITYEEHTFNALVGEKVRKMVEAHGVKVLVVQPAFGKDVPLSTRTNKANAAKVDMYYSIHANAAGSRNAKGLCAFYYKGSKSGLKLASIYAKYCKEAGFPAYSDDYMFESVPDTWSDFHELRETDMVAVITENGFMTNPDDFKRIFLNEDDFYTKLAYVHCKTILEYLGIKYNPVKSGESKPAAKKYPLDAVPVKNDHTYRLAKLRDSADPNVIEQLKKDGYIIIELPK